MELLMTEETLRAVALWTGANVLLLLTLGLLVTRVRIKVGAPVGTGDDAVLERAVRAHGNNAEYVPATLLLLFLAGATGLSTTFVFGLPITVLIDPEGREVARLRGDADWASPEAIAFLSAVIGRDG